MPGVMVLTGTGCLFCEDGLMMNAALECTECPAPELQLFLFISLFLSAHALVRYVLKRNSQKQFTSVTDVVFKITVSTVQVNSIALVFAFDWDAVSSSFISFEDNAASFGVAYLDIRCFFGSSESNFLTETVMLALIPLLIGAYTVLLFVTIQVVKAITSKNPVRFGSKFKTAINDAVGVMVCGCLIVRHSPWRVLAARL